MKDYLMIIDNDLKDIQLAKIALEETECRLDIKEFTSGIRALNYLEEQADQRHFPKFILLDLKMPKFDGIQVLRTLKANSDLMNIPVIIMTSSQQEKDIYISYSNHANAFIVKSIDFSEFTTSMRHVYEFWGLTNYVMVYS